jgi:colicin import membrane protein
VFKQYLSTLYDRVQQYWVLPDMRHWDAGLETVVVLTILRDGTVARTMIEKKSKDPFFDQFVMKTIQNAMPMPGFPKLMTQNSIEVGFRFRPGELLM